MNPEGLSEAKLAPKAFGVNYGQSGVSGHTELAPSEDSEVMIKHLQKQVRDKFGSSIPERVRGKLWLLLLNYRQMKLAWPGQLIGHTGG